VTGFALSPAARRRSLFVVISAAAVVAVTMGLTWPLLSLILEARGVDDGLIGLSAASQTFAIIVVMPFAPRLIAWLGSVRLMAISIAVAVTMLVLLPAIPDVYAWFPIRFLLGASVELLLFVSDVWVNQIAEERTRGRVIGLYGFVLSAGFAVGPLIVMAVGIEGWAPFLIGAAIVAMGGLPLLFARGLAPPIEGRPSGGLVRFVRLAPMLLLAGMMFGLIDSAVLSFLPIFGLDNGLDRSTVTLMITVLIAGSVAGQLPIGWFADRMDDRLMMIGCIMVSLAAGLLLPTAIGLPALLWPMLVIWGAALSGLYTLAMIMMGRRFRGPDLAGINAAYVLLWGMGGIAGPSIVGGAMEAWGPVGLPATVVVSCLLFLPLALWRYFYGRGK
jgi:MFS family permease